jgi:hypothetical protein
MKSVTNDDAQMISTAAAATTADPESWEQMLQLSNILISAIRHR